VVRFENIEYSAFKKPNVMHMKWAVVMEFGE
jgi:hypothetical protein